MLRNIYISLFLVFLTGTGLAQKSNVLKALRLYQSGYLDSSITFIDSAAVNPKTASDGNTWYYRGFFYKEKYNKQEKSNKQSPSRLISLESFEKFLSLDTTGKRSEVDGCLKSMEYLANTIYNDAASSINIKEFDLAITNFQLHKRIVLIINPNKDLFEMDARFHMVLASVYSEIYEQDRENNKSYFNKATDAYNYILDLDTNHQGANYNLGILYYNDAVNIIKGLDYDLDLITLELIQDECLQLFKKSLPFMKRAYALNPTRKEVLIGLSGIYFSMNELEKSEAIQRELELLEDN